jgi:hypothetical protein
VILGWKSHRRYAFYGGIIQKIRIRKNLGKNVNKRKFA